MKIKRLIVLGLMVLVLAIGLAGCKKITSALPDPNVPLVMSLGDSVTFKVDGPDEKIGSLFYAWSLNGHFIRGEKDCTFVVDPQKYDLYKQMEVECYLYEWRLGFVQGMGQVGDPPALKWDWFVADVRVWNISISAELPIWLGDYIIKDNTDVQSLKEYTTITGYLEIDNSDLTNLAGLENITSVRNLIIRDNATLESLSGLENLESVGGSLSIVWNDALTNLSGLENLASVGGGMHVDRNAALTLLGMTGLQKVGGWFYIYYNPLLCTSLAEELMSQVLAREGIGGERNIDRNKDCTTP